MRAGKRCWKHRPTKTRRSWLWNRRSATRHNGRSDSRRTCRRRDRLGRHDRSSGCGRPCHQSGGSSGQFIANNTLGVATFEFGVRDCGHISSEVINTIQPGHKAELAFDDLPGRILGQVKNINMGIPQGQVVARGELLDTTPVPHGRFLVQFTLDDDEGLELPAGAAGAVTYADGGRIFVPVRKVFFRWYTWLNYIMTDMDVRGQRQRVLTVKRVKDGRNYP